jgi:hypothetical protein
MARAAILGDLAVLGALLARAGGALCELRERIDDPNGGIIVADGDACVSWALDAGTLHLYDFAGDTGRFTELLDVVNALARARRCAVIATTVYESDPFARVATSLGFIRDWDELDVRGGALERLVGFVRETPAAAAEGA